MKTYRILPNEKGRLETIAMGKSIMAKKQMNQHSYLNLFLSTLQFIQVKTWVMQCFILLLIIATVNIHILYQTSFKMIMNSYLLLLIFSILFFLDELYKSFVSGMWELEQSFKYDLSQHTLMKLIVFGSVDIVLILLMSLLSNITLSIPLLRVLLYLLVPFNIFCILLFSTLTFWRNNMRQEILWIIAGVVGGISFVLTNLLNVYNLSMAYWGTGLLLTSCALIYVVYVQIYQMNKGTN
ncbi:hypothetical protein RV15_GL003026 [Enterococcus silesiacus]|uniref:Beta-carotene 15,15'-monooxygenase n=1 Tax=Enterococcus silesiacus TaxID=332949 RepID=A0AA91GI58_9ENTE|nr:hypothetical protein RV15_GL003026 [Enterococcus silesiacus]